MNYKVIKTSPYHKIGEEIDSKDYEWNPKDYPELFKELSASISITSIDGVVITEGDNCYYINNYKIYPCIFEANKFDKVFSVYKNAWNYAVSLIDITLDDGENIKGYEPNIYGVCTIAGWQKDQTDSLTLLINKSNNYYSTTCHWKYFKTKRTREDYIKWNKPMYSLLNIKNNNYKLD